MTLTIGTQLDRYEITGYVGKGAMGEVYRARDQKLGRDVAIKMLKAAFAQDEGRLRRFDHEARAAGGLNHPNVLVIYDVGTNEGAPFVVSELLEGENLRTRLGGATLPPRKAIEFASQVARGLGAAHAKGIVHRDLKPENLFVTADGLVKILDFGLAKLTRQEEASQQDSLLPTITEYGKLMGTVGYMAPEQVRGEAVDHRADIFSLGCVLYEMLIGRPPFQRGSAADTMAAIVRDDLPELPVELTQGNAALVAILRRCVEKLPVERFESARDLAFALDVLGGVEGRVGVESVVPDLTFRRITFRRGFIPSARFTPDAHSVIYSSSWEGKPQEIFWSHIGNPEARSLGLRDSDLLGVSSTNELALLLRTQWLSPFMRAGTLARVPPMGGTARELMHGVYEADWGPDGHSMAMMRPKDGMWRIEYPVGTTVFQTAGWASQARVSPDGNRVAFIHHPTLVADGGDICVVDRQGEVRVLEPRWGTARGLCWSPDGQEVWFSADREGAARGIYAVSLEGRLRRVLQLASNVTLHDIARTGQVLVAHGTERAGISALQRGETREIDLSWLDWSLVKDYSPDGRVIVFDESSEGGGSAGSVYLRAIDGSPAMRLGDGIARAISPDGSSVLVSQYGSTQFGGLHLLPTGVGEPRDIPLGDRFTQNAAFLPDARHIVVAANENREGVRLYLVDSMTGEHLAISPEGIDLADSHLLPHGDHVLAHNSEHGFQLYPLRGGEPQTVPFLTAQDRVIRWAKDANAVFIHRPSEFPGKIYRLDLDTGERTIVRELMPTDPTGIYRIARVHLSEDTLSYAYSYYMQLLDLHVIEGLR